MIGYSSARLLRSGLISFRIEGRYVTSKMRERLPSSAEWHQVTHTNNTTLISAPQASAVHLLTQQGDGLYTTEYKNKTTNIRFFYSLFYKTEPVGPKNLRWEKKRGNGGIRGGQKVHCLQLFTPYQTISAITQNFKQSRAAL